MRKRLKQLYRAPWRYAHRAIRRSARVFLLLSQPVVRPIAWRTRTFMLRPANDIEYRLSRQLAAISASADYQAHLVRERLDDLSRASSANAHEARLLHVSLRDAIERQADEIATLREQITALRLEVTALSSPNLDLERVGIQE